MTELMPARTTSSAFAAPKSRARATAASAAAGNDQPCRTTSAVTLAPESA